MKIPIQSPSAHNDDLCDVSLRICLYQIVIFKSTFLSVGVGRNPPMGLLYQDKTARPKKSRL